jgi:hypothetical protein
MLVDIYNPGNVSGSSTKLSSNLRSVRDEGETPIRNKQTNRTKPAGKRRRRSVLRRLGKIRFKLKGVDERSLN